MNEEWKEEEEMRGDRIVKEGIDWDEEEQI
jgi:hypothetical protein